MKLRRALPLLLVGLFALGPARSAPAGDARYGMGLRPTPPAEYEQFPVWRPAAAAPPLRAEARPGLGYRDERVDLRPYMPPPGNQGGQSSCVGWAVAYGALSFHEAVRRGKPPREADRQMSPAFLYNQINGGRDQGSLFPDALAVVRDIGGVTLRAMPYDDRDHLRQPSGDLFADAANQKLYGYARLEALADIRNALAMRLPVVLAMETSEKFLRQSNQWEVYRKADWRAAIPQRSKNRPHGLHAVVLVGYDDQRRAFLMQNSWGTEWGQGGYCWLSYDLFERIRPDLSQPVLEAWVLLSGRQVDPKAALALGIPSSRQGGVWIATSALRLDDGHWEWDVTLTFDDRRPVARVDWSWVGADERMRYQDGSGGEGDHVLRQRRREGGVVPVTADVTYADGGTQRVEARVFLAERLRPLRIRFRDRYWGRDQGRPTWIWWAELSGPAALTRGVLGVTWELDAAYDPSRIVQTRATPGGFAISGRADRPTRLDALVETREGGRRVTERVRSATAFFHEAEDQIRVVTAQGQDEEGPFLSLWLDGPYRDLAHVERVTWEVEGRRLETVSAGEAPDDVSFPLDASLGGAPTRALAVRAVLERSDGRTVAVEGRHVPVGR